MTRLQKYNQIILALAGTAVLGGTLIMLGSFLYYEVFRTRATNHEILDEAQLQEDKKEGIRRQKAEFEPVSFTGDTTSDWAWSAIEVTVKTLKKPEGVERKVAKPKAERFVGSSSYGSYWGKNVTNLILWNKATGENRLVFADRVVIEKTRYYGSAEMNYVLLIAQDTASERPALYHYSLTTGALTVVPTDGHVPTNLFDVPLSKTDDAPMVTLAIDADGNGKYDSEQEVTFPAHFNPETLKIEPVISDETKNRAQQILDGDATQDTAQ